MSIQYKDGFNLDQYAFTKTKSDTFAVDISFGIYDQHKL